MNFLNGDNKQTALHGQSKFLHKVNFFLQKFMKRDEPLRWYWNIWLTQTIKQYCTKQITQKFRQEEHNKILA